MKDYQPADIRNIAVVGHGDSGKTILCEAMLMCGGQINRIGSIEAGTTTSDYHPGEKERQISISRELTKIHEENFRGSLFDALVFLENKKPKGEFVLCLEGKK